MDFGDILDRWEREGGGGREKGVKHRRGSAARESLDAWLESHGVEDKDDAGASDGLPETAQRENERRRLAELQPQDRIDLHGMTASEATVALEAFLLRSSRAGLEKVLVVHGKGNHSSAGPVLGKVVRRVVERCPYAGRFGEAGRESGGRGAVWVLLRARS